MKFIADAMLGRLAKWMRIMGSDVAYYRDIQDRELIQRAQKEDRVILTRDTQLIRRRKAGVLLFLVQGDGFREQLKQVSLQFSLDPFKDLLSRCSACNAMLSEVDKEAVKGFVPEYVFNHQAGFRTCPGCSRIYWPATHRDAIIKTLQEIFKKRI
jgi:uncharacterized protein